MNTDELLARLAAEPPKPAFRPARLGLAVIATVVLCCALFLTVAGTRDDLLQAWTHPQIQAKTLLPALIALIVLPRALRSARPEHGHPALALLSIPLGAALALAIYAGLTLPPEARFVETTPPAIAECLGLNLLLTLPGLVLAIRLLRQGASTRPRVTGALTGLAVGAAATTGYSLFCTQDNPLFYVAWYGIAMATATAIGAWAGRRWLSW